MLLVRYSYFSLSHAITILFLSLYVYDKFGYSSD